MATTLTVHRKGCHHLVTTSIRFQDPKQELDAGSLRARLREWEFGARKLWNGGLGPQAWGKCQLGFSNDWQVGGMASGSHYVQVQGGRGDFLVDMTWLGPASTVGSWHIGSSSTVAAHEVGHLLGLPDEYGYDAQGKYVNLNKQPGGSPQSILAQTWSPVAALPEHLDKILANWGRHVPRPARAGSFRS